MGSGRLWLNLLQSTFCPFICLEKCLFNANSLLCGSNKKVREHVPRMRGLIFASPRSGRNFRVQQLFYCYFFGRVGQVSAGGFILLTNLKAIR